MYILCDIHVLTDSSEDEGDLQWLKTFQQDYVEVSELARSVTSIYSKQTRSSRQTRVSPVHGNRRKETIGTCLVSTTTL